MILFSKKHNEFNFSSLCCVKIIIVALLFILSFRPVSASAFNPDYLDKVQWVGNDKVISEVINAECPYGKTNGTFSYIVDPNEYTFYAYISISETTISEEQHEVSVDFQITGINEQYYFSVDSNGATDYLSNEDELFNVASNFNTYPVTKSGDYIVAVDIADGCDYNLISVHLNINGHRYSILRDLPVSAPIVDTTVKNTTKAKSKTSRSANKITKSKTKNIKASSDKTTKFSNNKIFSNTTTTVSRSVQTTKKAQYRDNNDDVAPAKESSEKLSGSKMTNQSKALLISAGAIGIAGVTIMIIAAAKGKGRSKENDIDSDKQDDNFNF